MTEEDRPKSVGELLLSCGEAKAIICEIINDDIFENLSKHNPYWDKDESGDKLHDIRLKLHYFNERLCEAWGKMK